MCFRCLHRKRTEFGDPLTNHQKLIDSLSMEKFSKNPVARDSSIYLLSYFNKTLEKETRMAKGEY